MKGECDIGGAVAEEKEEEEEKRRKRETTRGDPPPLSPNHFWPQINVQMLSFGPLALAQ